MEVSPYSEPDADRWDDFAHLTPMATFLHTRRFLAYHGQRFQDVSVFIQNQRLEVLALFPAAIDPQDARRVISHPGITFGGVLHNGGLRGEEMIHAWEVLKTYYAEQGFQSLRYKAIPYIYHQTPTSDDLYALFRLNAQRSRCDLSCAIDLANRRKTSSRRKRGLKKALSAGVEVVEGERFIDELWRVLEENLERKLGQKPVHTASEIRHLASLFAENIKFIVALLDGQVVSGITLFGSPSVARAQYIASGPLGYDVSALDAVFEHAINQSQVEGLRYFDFGASNRDEGRQLSGDLYQFKAEFGGGGVAQESYDIDLSA
jgi:hypothetical protein